MDEFALKLEKKEQLMMKDEQALQNVIFLICRSEIPLNTLKDGWSAEELTEWRKETL